jgi:hypothetical protein
MGYVVILLLSVAVGVVVYHASGRVPASAAGPETWVGPPRAEQEAAPRPPSNFERLSVSGERRSWQDRLVGILELIVAVAVGAAALTASLYLVGRAAVALLEKAVTGSG